MNVFIAGATGVLGSRLVERFATGGHRVVGLARSDAAERLIHSRGGESRRADLFDGEALARAAAGAEVVIHAATAIPTRSRTSLADWELNDRIRRDGTQALTSAAAKVGARLYVQQSIVWVSRPADGSFFDEYSPPHPAPHFKSALDGEQIAREAGERHGFTVAIPRFGGFYAADSDHTRQLAAGLLRRQLPLIGGGPAVWANLHADDAAAAVVAIVEAGRGGLWHVVDDRPATAAEMLRALASRIGAPAPWSLPVWLARPLAGSLIVDFFTRSIRTSNARFRHDLGWAPRYPSFEQGLDQVVAAWQAEGWLPRSRQRQLTPARSH